MTFEQDEIDRLRRLSAKLRDLLDGLCEQAIDDRSERRLMNTDSPLFVEIRRLLNTIDTSESLKTREPKTYAQTHPTGELDEEPADDIEILSWVVRYDVVGRSEAAVRRVVAEAHSEMIRRGAARLHMTFIPDATFDQMQMLVIEGWRAAASAGPVDPLRHEQSR